MTSKEALNNLIEELKWCCNDGKTLREYDKKMIEPIQRDLEILEQLKEILSMDYLVRVYGYDMAKRLQTYLKSNDIVKGWLENEI